MWIRSRGDVDLGRRPLSAGRGRPALVPQIVVRTRDEVDDGPGDRGQVLVETTTVLPYRASPIDGSAALAPPPLPQTARS